MRHLRICQPLQPFGPLPTLHPLAILYSLGPLPNGAFRHLPTFRTPVLHANLCTFYPPFPKLPIDWRLCTSPDTLFRVREVHRSPNGPGKSPPRPDLCTSAKCTGRPIIALDLCIRARSSRGPRAPSVSRLCTSPDAVFGVSEVHRSRNRSGKWLPSSRNHPRRAHPRPGCESVRPSNKRIHAPRRASNLPDQFSSV